MRESHKFWRWPLGVAHGAIGKEGGHIVVLGVGYAWTGFQNTRWINILNLLYWEWSDTYRRFGYFKLRLTFRPAQWESTTTWKKAENDYA
jgi:hypothetical protein